MGITWKSKLRFMSAQKARFLGSRDPEIRGETLFHAQHATCGYGAASGSTSPRSQASISSCDMIGDSLKSLQISATHNNDILGINNSTSTLLTLPRELRDMVWEYALLPLTQPRTESDLSPRLDAVCRQIRNETKRLYENKHLRSQVIQKFWEGTRYGDRDNYLHSRPCTTVDRFWTATLNMPCKTKTAEVKIGCHECDLRTHRILGSFYAYSLSLHVRYRHAKSHVIEYKFWISWSVEDYRNPSYPSPAPCAAKRLWIRSSDYGGAVTVNEILEATKMRLWDLRSEDPPAFDSYYMVYDALKWCRHTNERPRTQQEWYEGCGTWHWFRELPVLSSKESR